MEQDRVYKQRLTQQRRLVLQIIQNSQGHLDAEQILQITKNRGVKISLATIYRALTFLKETGLIQEHSLGEDHAHFEAAQASPHYHFTCKKCGRVIEFEAPQILDIVRDLCERQNLQVIDIHLLLNGYCADCQATSQESQSA